jgi:hypothetical protein
MTGGRTDLAEVAQAAGVETLWAAPGPRAQTLYGAGPVELRKALAALATPKRFGDFAHPFFARLAYKVLAYLLSRIVPLHAGDGRRSAPWPTPSGSPRPPRPLPRGHPPPRPVRRRLVLPPHLPGRRRHHPRRDPRFLGHAVTKLTGEFRRRAGPVAPERLVVCGTGGGRGRGPGPLELDIYRGRKNVRLQLQAVRRALWTTSRHPSAICSTSPRT